MYPQYMLADSHKMDFEGRLKTLLDPGVDNEDPDEPLWLKEMKISRVVYNVLDNLESPPTKDASILELDYMNNWDDASIGFSSGEFVKSLMDLIGRRLSYFIELVQSITNLRLQYDETHLEKELEERAEKLRVFMKKRVVAPSTIFVHSRTFLDDIDGPRRLFGGERIHTPRTKT